MNEEPKALQKKKNQTWELVDCPIWKKKQVGVLVVLFSETQA